MNDLPGVWNPAEERSTGQILLVGGSPDLWETALDGFTDRLKRAEFICLPMEAEAPKMDEFKNCRAVLLDYEALTPSQLQNLPQLRLRMPSTPLLLCVDAARASQALESLGTLIDDVVVKFEGYAGHLIERIHWLCEKALRQEQRLHQVTELFRQAQKMEALGILAGGIAHDFNNILSMIFGHTQMALLSLPAEDSARVHLDQALLAGNRARDLVREILNISRQEEGTPQKVRVGTIVKEATKFLKASCPSNIEIVQNLHMQPAGWDTILCDSAHLYQIFMNICTNALNAIGQDQYGTVSIELHPHEVASEAAVSRQGPRPGKYVSLKVIDSGRGIPHELMERIFDPYFSTMPNSLSLGMGLPVVKELVAAYNGFITVESRPGQGTSVTILLPCAEAASAFKSSDDGGRFITGSGQILLVDDEEMLVQVGTLMLNRLGYEVTGFTDSLKALECFRERPDAFDLVITDLTMPRMTGADLVRNLLALRSDLPVIVCSGYGDSIQVETLRKIGVRSFLRKPFILKLLAETVAGVLNPEQVSMQSV